MLVKGSCLFINIFIEKCNTQKSTWDLMNNIKANICVTTTQIENWNSAALQQTLWLRAFCLRNFPSRLPRDNHSPAFYGYYLFALWKWWIIPEQSSVVVWCYLYLKLCNWNHCIRVLILFVNKYIVIRGEESRVLRIKNFAGFEAASLRVSSGRW